MALLPVLLDMVDDIYENLDNPEKTMGDIPLLFVPHGRRRECPRRKEHSDGEGHGHRHCHGGPNLWHGEGQKLGHGEGHEHSPKHGEGHGHGHGHGHRHGKGHSHGHEQEEKRDESRGRGHCRRKEKRGPEEGHCRFAGLRKGFFGMNGWENCPRFAGRGCPYKKTLAEDFKVTFDVKSFNPDEISVKVKGREIFVDGKHDERADEQGFVSRQFTRRFVVPDEFDTDTIATYLDTEGRMTITASKPKPPVDESTERIIPIERVARVQEEVVDLSESSDTDKMDEDTNDSKKD